MPKEGKGDCQGVNMLTKQHKPRGQQNDPGGIIHQEGPIDASNVMLVCSKCGKATRSK